MSRIGLRRKRFIVCLIFLPCVLVHLGCYNKILQWVACKQQKFISHSFGGWSPRSGCKHDWVRVFFQAADFFTLFSYGGKGKLALWDVFCEGTNLTYEGCVFMT